MKEEQRESFGNVVDRYDGGTDDCYDSWLGALVFNNDLRDRTSEVECNKSRSSVRQGEVIVSSPRLRLRNKNLRKKKNLPVPRHY